MTKAYLLYAKQQRRAIPLIAGLLLLILPYLTDRSYLLFGGLVAIILGDYLLSRYAARSAF